MKILIFALFFFCPTLFAKEVLNIYNWADYMPASVIQNFEKETGIEIHYAEFDSNETMYAKLKSNPNTGYDLIFPSCYYIMRMRNENMLEKLDKSQIPNLKNLNPTLLNREYDPNNLYSLPYLWGCTGIVVNKNYINPQQVTGWTDFWKPQFHNQLLMFDDIRVTFGITLLSLGYSINETNTDHIHEAYLRLKQLLPNIKLFNQEAAQNIYIDEDAVIGMAYNGDIFNALTENPSLVFIYPKEGYELWLDCMAIPKNAPHMKNALLFINYLLRPEVAKVIALNLGYSTPNLGALALMPESYKKNTIINPSPSDLARGHFIKDLGPVNAIYDKYWNMLKVGE